MNPNRLDLNGEYEDDYSWSFTEANASIGSGWQGLAQISNVKRPRSWRVTVHEPRPHANSGTGGFQPSYLPIVAAAAGAVGRFVAQDAGLLLRVRWQRQQVTFEVIVDYCAGLSFTVVAAEIDLAVKAALNPAQLLPAGGGVIKCGASIFPSQQGSMAAWPPTRSIDTGLILPIVAGVTDFVRILIPPHARAFRWHQYAGAAAGASTAITFRQVDNTTAIPNRSVFRTGTTAASWPNATGAIPIVGTAQELVVENNELAGGATVAFWIEFLLDLGG